MTKNSGIEILDIKNLSDLKLRGKLFANSKETLFLRSNENILYLFEQNRGIHLIDKKNGDDETGFLSVKDEVVDMTVTENSLFLISKEKGISEYEINGKSLPVLKNVYNPPRNITQLAVFENWAFLAGEKIVTSVKLIPFSKTSSDHSDEITLNLPPLLEQGPYHLIVTSDDGREYIEHNAITITNPPLSKPKFTAEEYKKILEQMKMKEKEKEKRKK
jgi:hypothetical protein